MITNKKGVTFIEIIVVVTILLLLLSVANTKPTEGIMRSLEKQVVNDWLVNLNNEVREYSYNSITVGQDVVTDDILTNKDVSRYSLNKKLAFNHSIYFTTLKNDGISDEGELYNNRYFYLLQYRQREYINTTNRILESQNYNPLTSSLILPLDGHLWVEKYKIPNYHSFYLNKIVLPTKTCETGTNQFTYGQIIYSTSDLNFKFYKEDTYISNFDYTFCFSQDPEEYESENGIGIRLNRDRIKDYYYEQLENY